MSVKDLSVIVGLILFLMVPLLVTGCATGEKRSCRDRETGRYTECK